MKERLSPLSSEETELVGHWIVKNGLTVADDICNRIESLICNQLKKIDDSEDGWSILYIDPVDGRYWELMYPDSELQGGGPPKLSVISLEQAKVKYGI